MKNDREMPKYKCHKEVHALKIDTIEYSVFKSRDEPQNKGGCATITPVEEGYAAFEVDLKYLQKHNPQAGGYYVVYEDGYRSYSPAKAFEDGYTLIT